MSKRRVIHDDKLERLIADFGRLGKKVPRLYSRFKRAFNALDKAKRQAERIQKAMVRRKAELEADHAATNGNKKPAQSN